MELSVAVSLAGLFEGWVDRFHTWLANRQKDHTQIGRFTDALRAAYVAHTTVKPLGNWPWRGVHVAELFRHPQIEIEGKRARFSAKDILANHDRLLFEGLSGLGKSVLLRYLYAAAFDETISAGRMLPLLLSPEEMANAEDLRSAIDRHLQLAYSIDDPERFGDLFSGDKGQYIILLDDLHKLPREKQTTIASSVTSIVGKYPGSRVYGAARPGSEIGSNGSFDNVMLHMLDNQEDIDGLFEAIARIVPAGHRGTQCRTQIPPQLKDHIACPLHATILALCSTQPSGVPRDLDSLYSEWMAAIFAHIAVSAQRDSSRHFARTLAFRWISERSSSPFDRDWACNQSSDHQALFDALIIAGVFDEAFPYRNLYKFSHDRVAEFLAAEYVQESVTETKQDLYGKMDEDWLKWSGVLGFLFEIDKNCMVSCFLVKDLCRLSSAVFDATNLSFRRSVQAQDVDRFLQLCTVSKEDEKKNLMVAKWPEMGWWARKYRWYDRPRFYECLGECVDLGKRPSFTDDGERVVYLSDMPADAVNRRKVQDLLQEMLVKAKSDWRDIARYRRNRRSVAPSGEESRVQCSR